MKMMWIQKKTKIQIQQKMKIWILVTPGSGQHHLSQTIRPKSKSDKVISDGYMIYFIYWHTRIFRAPCAVTACPRQITSGSSPPGSFCFYKELGLNATRRPGRHGRELNNCCNNPLPSFMCQKVYMVIYIMWRLECTVNNCF